jgi:hypothetical protein
MQSYLYGTHHITVRVDGIRHDYDQANGPACLRFVLSERGQLRRPLVTRLRISLGSVLVAADGRLRPQRSGPETRSKAAETPAVS